MMTYELFSMWQNLGTILSSGLNCCVWLKFDWLNVWNVFQVRIRSTSFPGWSVRSWEWRWSRRWRCETSWSRFSMTWWTGSSARMGTSNRYGSARSAVQRLFRSVIENQRKSERLCTCVQVEAELIDKLDSLVSEGKGDENYRELFGLLWGTQTLTSSCFCF